jgi:hypothetical protein
MLGRLRKQLRGELESPEAERRFGHGWLSGVAALVLAFQPPIRLSAPVRVRAS